MAPLRFVRAVKRLWDVVYSLISYGLEGRMHRLLVVAPGHTPFESEITALLHGDEGLRHTHATLSEVEAETRREWPIDLVIVPASSDGEETVHALRLIASRFPRTPLLAILPADAEGALVTTVLSVVDDFIIWPPGEGELRHRIQRLLPSSPNDEASISDRLLTEMTLTKLVGQDPAFLRAVKQVPRFARFDMLVLITGETGTGKELCARAVHHLSERRNHPFIAVDCGAVPDTLFESELFGHVRGAFTDAHRAHKGLIAMCEGGTLLLDEIDALSLAAQAKLLRFLQEHTFRPLGSDRHERANVRVLAATNRDLDACVKAGQLRADLYFRLNVLRLHLPPLRERPGDIPLLASSLLKESGAQSRAASFSTAALRMLSAHTWPGNVRELSNVIQRAVVNCDGTVIQPSHITIRDVAAGESSCPADTADVADFRSARRAAVEAFERRYIEDLLRKHHGNVTHAAREAQQDRRAFGRFIKKHQINRVAV
jgi:DNA-binding NtrC family response regulator